MALLLKKEAISKQDSSLLFEEAVDGGLSAHSPLFEKICSCSFHFCIPPCLYRSQLKCFVSTRYKDQHQLSISATIHSIVTEWHFTFVCHSGNERQQVAFSTQGD
jgi:hypothetical protein